MPLQNRVTPFGDIVALPGRGLLMGNRGVLHDERRIVRFSQTRRWIACRIEFRGRHRAVMQPQRWTELFFLDEATALSAGHRPCAQCRYSDYRHFSNLWLKCFGGPVTADIMDAQLHSERLVNREKRTYREDIAKLPNGTYVAIDGTPWLIWADSASQWSDAGYTARIPRPRNGDFDVLTPRSIVAILAAGYEPIIHPSLLRTG